MGWAGGVGEEGKRFHLLVNMVWVMGSTAAARQGMSGRIVCCCQWVEWLFPNKSCGNLGAWG